MKKAIDGKSFDTETADCLGELPCSSYPGDFQYHKTYLYRSPKGQYFLSGSGGPMSMWSEPYGNNGSQGGSGLCLIDKDDARIHAERIGLTEKEMTYAGFQVVEG